MSDRPFSHPNFGHEVRIEQQGKEVRLVFVTMGVPQAESFARNLLKQIKDGAIHLTLMGKPTSIKGEL